ncbi:MAG: cyclic nucleotide-binding domain-containing protein, partial [Ectothiorhodospiraceae bacterium]|nr:cyclic nucleotide-binding domain-containing protein [Ectothiorhodospiraceae bacterium]
MTTAVALETFRRLSLAQELSDPQCERLLSVMTLRTLSDGDVLIEEGQRDDALYLLIDGALSVCNRTGGGDWNIIHVLKSGDVAGELGFLDGEPRTATLRSLGTVRVLEL